jgi:glycine/D-amino acid oxidase-like deaminating enzyme
MHVAVIGTGIIGSSVAYESAKAGAKVTIFDAGSVGRGTSATRFAWTNATGKSPLPYFALNVAGMRAHLELKRDFGETPWFTQTGSVEWRTTKEGHALLLDNVKQMRDWGYGVELIDKGRLAEMEPDIDVAAIGDGPIAYYPEEGWVDPTLYAGWLLRAAAERWDTTVRTNTRIAEVETKGGRVKAVGTSSGERIECDAVVNCTGRWADEALGGVPAVPLASNIGVLAFTPPVALTLRSQFHSDDLDVRPDGAGRIMIHKVSVDDLFNKPETLRTDGAEAKLLLDATREFVPALRTVGIEAIRTTVRPIPADGLTCAGEMPHVAGYYVAVTHSGVTLAPYLGKAVADEVVRGKMHDELSTFRPNRFFSTANTVKGGSQKTVGA